MLSSRRKNIKIKDIKISGAFRNSPVSADKVMARINFHNKHGVFDREILVDENLYLIDGYSAYIACMILGVDTVRALCVKKKLSRDDRKIINSLYKLIRDITAEEIISHIEREALHRWCDEWSVTAELLLRQVENE